MAAGIMSFLLLLIFSFMTFGGWLSKDIQGRSFGAVLFIATFIAIYSSPMLTFSFFDLQFGGLLFSLPLLVAIALFKRNTKEKTLVTLSSILIAILFNLIVEVVMLDPVLLIVDERLFIGIICGIVIGFMTFSLAIKYVISSLGLWLGMLYFILKHYKKLYGVSLFSYYELDYLFIIFMSTTVVHLFIAQIVHWSAKKGQPSAHETK